jgi:hypothetical protein
MGRILPMVPSGAAQAKRFKIRYLVRLRNLIRQLATKFKVQLMHQGRMNACIQDNIGTEATRDFWFDGVESSGHRSD